MKPKIPQLSKRISLSPIVNIHAYAYSELFRSRVARVFLTLSYLSLYCVALLIIFGGPLTDITALLVASLGIAIPIALTMAYVLALLIGSIMVVRTNRRVRAAKSEPIPYNGHISVLLNVLEYEALALGKAGRTIRFLGPDGRAHFILKITTYAPYMGYPGIDGFPRRIYFILENVGCKTWSVSAIEHRLYRNPGRRIILAMPKAEFEQWVIPQWLSQVVAKANMKEARFARGE